MPDLWPPDLGEVGNLKVPHTLLKEQANYLAKHSKNLLEGRLISESDDSNEYQITWHFQIYTPALNYRYVLLSITHNIELYPLMFETEDPLVKKQYQETLNRVENEDQLTSILRTLFSTDRTKRIVRALMVQSAPSIAKMSGGLSADPPANDDDIPF